MMRARAHELTIEADDADHTVGACSCGGWQREVTLETVAVTGLPRAESLRAAHEAHVREASAPPPVPRVPP